MGRPAAQPSVYYKAAEFEAPAGADFDTLEFVASDETVDRWGDVIRVDGWELAEYRRNPMVLFAHDSANPIGTAERVWKTDGRLMARIRLAAGVPGHLGELIAGLRALIAQKILRAVSVGFRPTREPKERREKGELVGYEFIGQELLEISIVAIGANPN